MLHWCLNIFGQHMQQYPVYGNKFGTWPSPKYQNYPLIKNSQIYRITKPLAGPFFTHVSQVNEATWKTWYVLASLSYSVIVTALLCLSKWDKHLESINHQSKVYEWALTAFADIKHAISLYIFIPMVWGFCQESSGRNVIVICCCTDDLSTWPVAILPWLLKWCVRLIKFVKINWCVILLPYQDG